MSSRSLGREVTALKMKISSGETRELVMLFCLSKGYARAIIPSDREQRKIRLEG